MVLKKRGGLRRRRGPRRQWRKKSAYKRIGRGTAVLTQNAGVPDKVIVKMPYFENFSLINAAGPVANYFWNLNSIWDPNRSGIGHNPTGYATWNQLYNRYRVIGVKARVIFTAVAENTTPAIPFIYGGNETVQGGSYEQLEQPHTKQRVLVAGGGRNSVILTKYFNIARLAGASSTTYMGSDRYQAQFGASPSEVITMTAGLQSMSGNVQPVYTCAVHLTYYVELFDRKNALYTDVTPELRGPESNVEEPSV